MPPVSIPTLPSGLELNPEDIVISGISGQLPNCANLKEFRDKLFNKEELLTSTKNCWDIEHPDLPPSIGTVEEFRKFDAEFFGFDSQLVSKLLDSQHSKVLEDSYEAILDAGIHPSTLRGRNVAVVVGSSQSDHDGWMFYDTDDETRRQFIAWRAMIPHLVSSFFGLRGSSFITDTACSSFLYGFVKAYEAIEAGECESALVCCSNLLYSHITTVQFYRLGVLSSTPHCRPMDVEGDGYVRSEAVGAVLLQRARDAKRAYAVVVHAETNADGFKEENITFPSRPAQARLLRSVYSSGKVDAQALTYMEVHGTGTKVGDPVELGAIEDVFYEEGRRTTPLLIGSVKSNLGHSEASSGFCSLAKILIMMQAGYIPPTINFTSPRKEIASLHNGRLRLVTESTSWQPGLVAINNFGFGGANAHVVLRPGPCRRGQRRPSDTAPRLVLASGRTEEAALALVQLAAAGGADVDAELVRLLHELSATPTPGHAYRAFALVPAPSALPAARRCGDARPAMWLALAGAGAWAGAWAAAGAALQRLPAFAAALRRRDASLADALSDAAALQEALLEVLRAALLGVELVEAELALELPADCVSLLVVPGGEATRAVRAAQGERGKGERVVALFGDADGGDPLLEFLCALGKLYCLGVQINPAILYEDVVFPVSVDTPMISPHVLWNHENAVMPTKYDMTKNGYGVENIRVSLVYPEHQFMKGHIIDGRNLLPATGYLYFAWNTFAESITYSYETTSVVFEDVRFLRATHVPYDYGQVSLRVTIHPITGAFEVSEGTTAVVTGYVRLMTDEDRSQMLPPAEPWDPSADAASPHMTPRDVYKALRLRGYNYSGLFRGIAAASCDGRRGLLRWDDNWVTFLDCMMQLQLLPDASGALAVPTAIQRLCIDVANHTPLLREVEPDQVVTTAMVDAMTGAVRAGGAELRGVKVNVISRRKPAGDPVLERYDFAPYRLEEEGEEGEEEETWAVAVRVCAQIALENRGPLIRGAAPLTALEVITEKAKMPLAPLLMDALGDLPLIQVCLKVFFEKGVDEGLRDVVKTAPAVMLANVEALRDETDAVFVVGTELLANNRMTSVAHALSPAGCVVTLEETTNVKGEEEEQIRATGLRLVLRWRRGRHALLLLRKGGWEVDARHATVVHIRQEADEEAGEAFAWLPTLQAALREARRPEQRVLLVAEGQPLAGAQGLFNCLRQEPGPGRDKLRLYVLEEGPEPFSLESDAYRKQLELDLAVNDLRGGRWGCLRHFLVEDSKERDSEPELNNDPSKHVYCDAATLGDLSSFTWFEGDLDPKKPSPFAGEELIHVYYAALNFKDVMLASGKLNAAHVPKAPGQGKSLLGFEIAGRSSDGRRVVGLSVSPGCISTLASCRSYYIWDVPDHWTLEEAATVPAAYSTAVYALMTKGRMRKGDSLLVHAGSGGVGQAAIHLALAQGCRVFATAGTDAKRRFLLQTFPQLAAEDVGNSRDCSFEALVLRRTAGRGVDLVLNSLAGDKLLASLRCLAPGGRFLEIGKFDMQTNTLLGAVDLSEGRSFYGIHLDLFWYTAPETKQRYLANVLKGLIEDGSIKPLTSYVFERSCVEQAFRFMAGGKHTGKVLIRIRPEEQTKAVLPSPIFLKVKKRFHCRPDCSYVISGGLGGLGLELADWLVSRGCCNLVLTSRKGVSNGYQARKMLIWQRKGVRVHIFTGDAATHAGADALLRAANALAPLAAIFNLAVVLRDGLFDNQTVDAFVESYRCKALATRRLDKASRRLCPSPSHFVVFSSVSCGRGNAGQTNYGLANSVMEGVVRGRREAGLPATAVQWGAVGDVGLVADMRDDDRQLEIGGTLQQRLSSCLEVLDGFLASSDAVLSSMVVAEKKSREHGGDLVALVADIFGIKDVGTISPESTLAELGLDSMMAVEIQQALERDFEISLTVQDLRALTFSRLSEIQKKCRGEKEGEGSKPAEVPEQRSLVIFPWEQLLPLARGHESLEEGIAVKPLGEGVGSPVLLLPGGDDHAPLLQPLAGRLRTPSGCLYMGSFCSRVSVWQMVNTAMAVVRNFLEKDRPFTLIGYSYGGLFALEIAARLEEEGLRGSVVLLDSSPDFIRACLLTQLGGGFDSVDDIPDSYIESNFACTLLKTFEGLDLKEARKVVEGFEDWEQRLARALRGAERHGFSTAVLTAVVEKMIARICSVRGYCWPESRPKLACPIALLRPKRSPFCLEEYGLSKISARPVDVYCIDNVDHYSILQSPQTVEIINKIILEEKERSDRN